MRERENRPEHRSSAGSSCELRSAPQGDENAPLQALIFDAFYDNYRGAICFIRVKQGTIRTGMRMRMMATGGEFDIVEVGTFAPSYQPCDELKAGDVGYVAASIRMCVKPASATQLPTP